MKGFGNIVRIARKEAGLTQIELADLAGIKQTYLSQIESNKKVPTIKTLNDLANATGYELEINFTKQP